MGRKYEKTHPWINFSLDANRAAYFTWMLLGEAQSKCGHIAGALLDPAVARQLYQIYLVKGVLATTAIEGNTLNERQVMEHLAGRLQLSDSKQYLRQEIDNIITACNHIADSHFSGSGAPLCIEEIKAFNKLVLKDLPPAEHVVGGEIRAAAVGVGRYRGAPPEDCAYLLEKLCNMLNGEFSLGKRWQAASGILKAIWSHLYIAWIHPFGDGNGRTARLVEFKLCVEAGIPAPACHLLSNHYNETRSEYYRVLEASSREKDPFLFINYALLGYVDQLQEQIAKITQTQEKAFWITFVHTQFSNREGEADKRRRRLVIDLSEKNNEWTKIADIEMISSRLNRAYSSKGARVKTRDLNELVKMGLIERAGNKIRPNIGLISAYLPPKAVKAAS